MRVELYGCAWDGGVAAYSMPQGDKRGTAYEFYDWTYDGEWRGTELVNGLGLLTDGDYGPENFKLAYYAKSELGYCGQELNVTYQHGDYIIDNNKFVSTQPILDIYFPW